MSSLQACETVSLEEKSKTIFRRDSFDKIQSTANYSLQLAATILSRESLMHLFDAFVSHARTILHKAVLLLSLPAFKMCYAVVLFWIDSFTKYTGINVAFEKKVVTTSTNVEPEKTYILRVQKRKFIAEIPEPKSKPAPADSTSGVSERLTPITEMDLHVLPRQSPSTGSLSRSDSESEMGSNTSISSRQHHLGLVVIVYGSATFVYVQLMLLAVFLQSTATPPGLIFLVTSLALIGYIVYKMCFVRAKSKEEPVSHSLVAAAAAAPSPSKASNDSATESKTSRRLSRSMTRRFLYFHNKTLSKIKLL